MESRRKRAQLREDLKEGKLTLEKILDMKDDEAIGRMRASALLESLPGIGVTRAAKLMERAGIAPSHRIKGIGPKQREKLLKLLKEH